MMKTTNAIKVSLIALTALLFAGCGGGGGGSSNGSNSPPPSTTPKPVVQAITPQKTSYLNAKNIGMTAQKLPSRFGTNAVKFVDATEQITAGYAYGDFFRDGTYSMIGFSNNFAPPTDPNYGRIPGHAYFYKKDANGNWIDRTSDLMADQTGCISPRKVIVADFNGDKAPDVFVACHGTDLWPLPPGYKQGEVPRMLLSQPDGTYKNTAAPIDCYCHGATAADVNDNGFADIIVVDHVNNKQPFYLVNENGIFKPDYTRMPISTAANTVCDPACARNIFSVELIDFNADGKFDLLAGGTDDNSVSGFATTIFTNDGSNTFVNAPSIKMPLPIGADAQYNNLLDVVFINDNIYLMRVNSGYTGTAIQKIDGKTFANSTIYSNNVPFANGNSWFEWMLPANGNIVSSNSTYNVSIPQ